VPPSAPVAILVYVVAVLGMAFKGMTLALLWSKRHEEHVKFVQPMLSGILVVGGLAADLTPFFLVGEASAALCALRPTWFVLAFSLMLAPLIVKTWRIWRIFDNPSMKNINLSKQAILMRVAKLMVANAAIIALVVAVPAALNGMTTGDAMAVAGLAGVEFEYETCNNRLITFLVELAVQGALVGSALFLAWKVRNVYDEFNESKVIFQSVLVITLAGVLVLPIMQALPASMAAATFAISSLAIVLVTSIIVGSMLLPKVLRILQTTSLRYSDTQNNTQTGGGGNTMSSGGSHTMRSGKSNTMSGRGMAGDELDSLREDVERLQDQLDRSMRVEDQYLRLVEAYRAEITKIAGGQAAKEIEDKINADGAPPARASAAGSDAVTTIEKEPMTSVESVSTTNTPRGSKVAPAPDPAAQAL